ncbi:TMEM175 family protein [Zavarzinia sp.]|uniref:TMEM175 family protein n=1 Tax=Zavarzinia sp. TaxID=2027920 RepID=UPI0035641A70
MGKGRLEAFTDGVIAIIITIIVLELKVPESDSLEDLLKAAPVFLAYAFSFINVGLYWNNHHHMLHATKKIDGRVLWANHALLFWLSLVPFVIRWVDESHFSPLSCAAYGVVMVMAAIGYMVLERCIVACNGRDAALARAVGADWKTRVSIVAYATAIGLAFVSQWLAIAIYAAIAAAWFIPDRRIETVLLREEGRAE